jgi:tRNA pseudouridine13 synthase
VQAHNWCLQWPSSTGKCVANAGFKQFASDFQVSEVLDKASIQGENGSGNAGEHLCIRLQKTGDNTEYVARELATMAGLRSFDVSFCGLKDRHAVTWQWFSLYRPGQNDTDADFIASVSERWPVVDSCRSASKLRRGDHSGNSFRIILRNVIGDETTIHQALERLAQSGAPNYFGPQRFGHNGANLDQALLLNPRSLNRPAKGRGKGRGRGGRSSQDSKNVLYFSAARSWLFNEVLAERVNKGNWHQPMAGEPDEFRATGPLWGDGGTCATGEQEQLERALVAANPQMAALFASTRMRPERRPLQLVPENLEWEWQDSTTLVIEFTLGAGQYATTLLADVFALQDIAQSRLNE